jgi:hypothetical protein
MTPQQQAGITTMVFSPRAWRANFMAMVAPHPGHPRCPGFIKPSWFTVGALLLSIYTSFLITVLSFFKDMECWDIVFKMQQMSQC